jgi:hypothetical protein
MWVDITGIKGPFKCCMTYLRFSRSVMLTALGLFPAMDPLDLAWREHMSLTDMLLTTDPSEVTVHQLLRLLEAVYNMQVFRLSTQGMLSLVLMDATVMRDILTLDLQFERQTVAHLQQEIVALVPSTRSNCTPRTTR